MSKENLKMYEQLRKVPEEAKKEITGGRLKGFTDINPMWRIKALTEAFGMVGVGWYFDLLRTYTETYPGTGETALFADINLYVKSGDEWSKPIFGNGGSMLLAKEKYGMYMSDEAVKMAITDAISSAAKLLGVAADVYFAKDRTKYDQTQQEQPKQENTPPKELTMDEMNALVKSVIEAKTLDELTAIWTANTAMQKNQRFYDAVQNKGAELKKGK